MLLDNSAKNPASEFSLGLLGYGSMSWTKFYVTVYMLSYGVTFARQGY
jgi:hypothetical protein